MLDRTVEILGRLVSFPTVSADSNLALIDYVGDLLATAGARMVTTTDAEGTKANILVTFGPDIDGGVVLSGHTDVVPADGQEWTRHPFRAEVDGGRVWGRGTSDMKGFIACVLAMAPVLAGARLTRPVHIALTYDEEVGCHGAKVMLANLARSGPLPAVAIIGEPTQLGIVVAHKGCYEFTTEIHGVERHASLAATQASAIAAAARFIGVLDALSGELAAAAPADSPFDPPGTTINVGRIAGGVARNITAGWAAFDWEMRPIDGDDAALVIDHVDRYVADVLLPAMRREFAGSLVSTTTVGAVGGLARDADGPGVALARRITDNSDLGVVSFGTEAGLFQELGISPVVCGPGSIDQAHKPDEFIELSQLEGCLAMLGRLVADVSESG